MLVAQRVSGRSVAHGMRFTLGHLLGGDEAVWSVDREQLQPLGGEGKRARGDDGPALLVVGGLRGEGVERLDKLHGAGNGFGKVAKCVWNQSFPFGHLLFFGVFWRPLGDHVKGTAPVGGSDDFLWVHVGSCFAEISPELRNGAGGINEGSVAVEEGGVDVENGWLVLDGHFVCKSSSE